jgi:hypothetical protein
LIKVNTRGIVMWKRIGAQHGMYESVGKTFVSREFVNINSTNFIFGEKTNFFDSISGKAREAPFQEVKYISLALIKGYKRSGIAGLEDEGDSALNAAARLNQLMNYTPDHLKKIAYTLFIKFNRKRLETMKVPWFIPQWLGGVGLTPLFGFSPSRLDLQIARQIIYNFAQKRPKRIAQLKSETQSKFVWKIRGLCEENYKTLSYISFEDSKGVQDLERIRSLQAINLIFDSNISFKQLREKLEKGIDERVDYNQRMWDPSRYKKLPAPIDYESIRFRQSYEYVNLFDKNKIQLIQEHPLNLRPNGAELLD